MPAPLPIVSPPVVHHVKYLERHEVVLALKRGAWSAPRGDTVEIRDAEKGSLLFTFRTDRSSPCLYNSYGNLIFFFPRRVRDGVTEINAHDSSRRADMRVAAPASLALPCGTEARISLTGGMFGPNGDGNVLLLDEGVPVVSTSATSPPRLASSVIVNKDTYFITVAPGFDISLAVAACLIFEQLGS
ncbi:hypothetical protein CC85DRAFT_330895 [Cutaneotrichosporon oleaginosum]|uniref:DUF567-domain-containing protein n=1 Tax=Cutaneotrichosporon oleaginosum TaxID=879819 RepID=A0A0J0XDU5_9TREE|nr:uncharacterized protein CC85DRAFT_330895 [Cutaneotrichosporon oleaginosum]KLT39256.1 hypothetical protein CC85DRAFT_330895 [Cutaneotrichosporon oleaginosum]TXT09618.1 hypothetical protein COLE_03552 [Cutaneotrichosporon oleaginosum]